MPKRPQVIRKFLPAYAAHMATELKKGTPRPAIIQGMVEQGLTARSSAKWYLTTHFPKAEFERLAAQVGQERAAQILLERYNKGLKTSEQRGNVRSAGLAKKYASMTVEEREELARRRAISKERASAIKKEVWKGRDTDERARIARKGWQKRARKFKLSKESRKIVEIFGRRFAGDTSIGDEELFYRILGATCSRIEPINIATSLAAEGYEIAVHDVVVVMNHATKMLEDLGRNAAAKEDYTTARNIFTSSGFWNIYFENKKRLELAARAQNRTLETVIRNSLRNLGKRVAKE